MKIFMQTAPFHVRIRAELCLGSWLTTAARSEKAAESTYRSSERIKDLETNETPSVAEKQQPERK